MVARSIFCLVMVLSVLVGWSPPHQFDTISQNEEQEHWVDSVFKSMTLEERIAQLFMIEVRPTYGPKHLALVEKQIKEYKVGGVIFFKGNPTQQLQLTNQYQKISKTPLLVAIDGEWGLAMRLKNIPAYPYQLGLGGIQNDNLIYQMGKEMGRQCKRLGVHVNFAPVIDINNNPNNPVINYRSFGEIKETVARKGWAYAQGMQDAGIMACAKHFPGHGDTDVDSHKDLPVINHPMERLEDVEFYPFQYLIDQGVQSVMTAHLYIPAIDSTPNTAISISSKAINGLLRSKMGFKGLAFTDALNMQGVAKFHAPGGLELKALKAGNDILLSPGNIPKAIQLIKMAIVNREIEEDYVFNKVRKILKAKYDAGLHQFEPLPSENLLNDLVTSRTQYLISELVERQQCLLIDDNNLVPFNKNSNQKIAHVTIGNGSSSAFQKYVAKYHSTTTFNIGKTASKDAFTLLKAKLTGFDVVIIGLHKTSKYPPNYGVTKSAARFVRDINARQKTILVNFGNPYNLKHFGSLKSIFLAYQDNDVNHLKAANALFGASRIDARLSVSIEGYPAQSGLYVHPRNVLYNGDPSEVGIPQENFDHIDDIAQKAIKDKATPGCQILIAKSGKIIYHKSFGYFTYDKEIPVSNESLYDIASITKIAATTLSLMKLKEDGFLALDDKMSKYLPVLKGSNKEDMSIRQVLEHKAGLKDWIPFYFKTMQEDTMYNALYTYEEDSIHNIYVGNGLYMDYRYKDSVFKRLIESKMRPTGRYRYSDLGMILMKELIETVTEIPFEDYVDMSFYKPLGLESTLFKPLNKFDKNQIVPTELSIDMRKDLIWGDVHDPACAMLGGVSGHAGLFSTTQDLAVLMQMLLNGGVYDNLRLLNEGTIQQFTTKQARDSRRGLGFDKPETNPNKGGPTSKMASPKTFGHSGFTGTQVWADPEHELIFVFLSNRVHPTSENKKLIRNNVRTTIMDEIYFGLGYSLPK